MRVIFRSDDLSGGLALGRTNEPKVAKRPVDWRLAGQNPGINSFIRGDWLWVDEMIYD